MVTQELLSYIKVQLGQGVATDVISTALISQGWSADDVASALATLKPAAAPVVVPAVTPVAAPISNPVSAPVSTPVSNSFSSPMAVSAAPHKSPLVPFLTGAFVATAIITVLGYFFVYPKLVVEPSLLIEASDSVPVKSIESISEQVPAPVATSTLASTSSASSTVALVQGGQVPPSERQAVIAGILKTREVYMSKDAVRLRSYLKASVVEGSDDMAELNAMSDDDLSGLMLMISPMYESLTSSGLNSSTTVWTVETPMIVKIRIVEGSSSQEVVAKKPAGIWY